MWDAAPARREFYGFKIAVASAMSSANRRWGGALGAPA